MDVPRFTTGEAIKEGFRLTKENLAFLVLYQIFLFFLAFIFSVEVKGVIGFLWHFLGWIVVILAKMGYYNSSLLITKKIKPSFDQLYKNGEVIISWVIANFIFVIAVTIGFILFIVPGCYIFARYGLFPFFILDKKNSAIEALKHAREASEGVRWHLFLFYLACLGLNILGLLFFGIGILFTGPLTLIAWASVYRKLTINPQVAG